MTVDVLMLMEITSVFVLMDLMVQTVKVTKTQCSCFRISYSYFKSYKVWPALYQISISMAPYVLLDVQWCSKTYALKILLTTSGFTEYQKIYSAHEADITWPSHKQLEVKTNRTTFACHCFLCVCTKLGNI
jgi:hypothetical protein